MKSIPMVRRIARLAFAFILASAALPLAAETASDPAWGFSFPVPAGWKMQTGSGGAILGHDRIAGLILVLPHSAGSLAEMREQMLEGLVDEGVELSIVGALEKVGTNVLGGACAGYLEGQEVKGRTLGAVSPSGGGAYVIAVTTPASYQKELAAAADQIAKGMQFAKADTSELARSFVGTWTTMTTNTETSVTLAAGGQFSFSSESSYGGSFSDSGGGDAGGWGTASNRQSRGRWTVRGTRQKGILTLAYEGGERAEVEYAVHVENGETYWNEYYFDGELYGRAR
jgi:hypothetical protein